LEVLWQAGRDLNPVTGSGGLRLRVFPSFALTAYIDNSIAQYDNDLFVLGELIC